MASFNFNMMSKQRKDENPRNGYMNLFKVPKLQMPTEVPDSQFGQTPVFRKPFAPPPRPSPATSTPFFESSERSSAPFFNMDSQFGKTQTQTQTQSQNQTQPDFFGNVGDLNFDSLEIISQASSSGKSGDCSLTEILNEIRSLNEALHNPTDELKVEDLEEQVEDLEETKLDLIDSNEMLEEEKIELMLQLEDQKEEMNEFAVKLEETAERLAEANLQVDSLKEAVAEFEQFKMLHDKVNIKEQFKKRVESMKAAFEETKSRLVAKLEKKRSDLEELEANYGELKDANNQLKLKLTKMEAHYELKLKDAMHEGEKASTASAELEAKLAQVNTELNQMVEKLKGRERDKDDLAAEYEAKLQGCSEAVAELEQSYDKLYEESFALTSDVAKLYFVRKSALAKIKALEGEKENMEAAINNAKQELTQVAEKSNAFEAENENLKEKVQILQHSAESFKFIQNQLSEMITSKEEFQLIVAQKDEVIADLTAKNKEYQETIEKIQAEKEGLYRSFQEMVTRADRVLSSNTTAVSPRTMNSRESEKEKDLALLKSPRKSSELGVNEVAPVQPKTPVKSILKSPKRESKTPAAPTASTTSTRKRKLAGDGESSTRKSVRFDTNEALLPRYTKAANKESGKSKEKGVDMSSVKKSVVEEPKRPVTKEVPKPISKDNRSSESDVELSYDSQDTDLFLDIFA